MIRLGMLWPVLQLFTSDNNSNEILIQRFEQSLKPYNKLKTYLHFYKPILVSSIFKIYETGTPLNWYSDTKDVFLCFANKDMFLCCMSSRVDISENNKTDLRHENT